MNPETRDVTDHGSKPGVVFILGATGFIGSEIVRLATEQAWTVIAFARDTSKILSPSNKLCLTIDLKSIPSIEQAFQYVGELGITPVAAVNCAGVTQKMPFLSQTTDSWDDVFGVNLRGVWKCIQLEAEAMRLAGGSIVNLGSIAGLRANGWGESPYIASKHGLVGLTKAAAIEFGPLNIRANIVCPSVVDGSPFLEELNESQVDHNLARKQPTGRLVSRKEVAETVLWLCSPLSSGINGQAIAVDGGLTAK